MLVLAAYLWREPLSIPLLGEVVGVLATLLITASLLLMLRFPALARLAGGLEQLYTLHRGVGLAGYGLALLHPLLLAYHSGWELLELDGKEFDFSLGWEALLVLMVILLCTFWLKTKGYAVWRRLHTLVILAYLLMIWHVVGYAEDWVGPARGGLYVILLLGVLAPVIRYWWVDQGRFASAYVVEQVSHPTEGVIDMHLKPSETPLAIVPGQFVFARFLSQGGYVGCGHFHPFTASGVLENGGLRLSIKASGHCTRQMLQIAPGVEARLQGPYGELFQNVREDSQVWIAGGIGVTPFMARARALAAGDTPVRFFYFFDNVQDAAFLDELDALVRSKPNLKFHPVATYGMVDPIESIFDALLPPWNDKHYVLCGSDGFTTFLRAYLEKHAVPAAHIFQERFEFR